MTIPNPTSRALTLGGLLSLNLIASPGNAAVDAMQASVQQAYQQGLRWDNVDGRPFWLEGAEPCYSSDWHMHVIKLHPGQHTAIHLPAYETLRIHTPGKPLTPRSLRVYRSDGSGLSVTQALQTSTDGESLIVSPNDADPSLIYLEATESIELAVFVSRRMPLGELAPYPNFLNLATDLVWLSRASLHLPEPYWRLPAQATQTLTIQGPARLLVRNRLHYETDAAALNQDYRLKYRIDQQDPKNLDFSTSVESVHLVSINLSSQVVGREQMAFLEIPAGRHELEIQADRTLYLQLLAQTEHDYLLPALNEPLLPVQTVRRNGVLATENLSQTAQAAEQQVKDNSRRDSAMMAVQRLRHAALARPDYPEGRDQAEKMRGLSTFYRDLLPIGKVSAFPPFKAYFLPKRIRPFHPATEDAQLADQHLGAALQQTASGLFNATDATPNEYLLPDRLTESQLRLIIDKRDCADRHLKLQIDQAEPLDVWLNCKPALQDDEQLASLAGAAMERLQEGPSRESLRGVFSAYREPGPLIAAASVEIMLPKSARAIKIWASDALSEKLNVALQYRASKPSQLSEQSYLALLKDVNGPEQWFEKLRQPPGSAAEEALQNDWLPLLRLIEVERNLFSASVAGRLPSVSEESAAQLAAWSAAARQFEQRQQWQAALAEWSKVVLHSNGDTQERARLAQAGLLIKLDEYFLAESLWRYLALYAGEDIAQQATDRLLTRLTLQNDRFGLQSLRAARFSILPTHQRAAELAEALSANGEYRFALLLSLATPDKTPLTLALKAAYQLDWWHSFAALLDRLPADQRNFWLGLKAQKAGDYEAAAKFWQTDGKPWLEHLREGRDLPAPSVDGGSQNRQSWANWLDRHPGDRVWREAPGLVSGYAASNLYYAIERDLYSAAFRGTPEQPLRLTVQGPSKLKLQIRPLHPKNQPHSAIDGWIRISDNGRELVYPFGNNIPSQGLTLAGDEQYQPGVLETLEYQVGAGEHDIQLFSMQTPLSVGVEQSQPELLLTAQPALTAEQAIVAPDLQSQATADETSAVTATASQSLAIDINTLSDKNDNPKSPVTTLADAQRRMVEIAWLQEADPDSEQFNGWLLSASRLHERFADDDLIQQLWLRISSYSEWQNTFSVISEAGVRFVKTSAWQPESPEQQLRKSLMPATAENDYLLSDEEQLVFSLLNAGGKTLEFRLRLSDIDFLPPTTAKVGYQIDDQPERQIEISREDGWLPLTLHTTPGNHQLRFHVDTPVSNQFLLLRVPKETLDFTQETERSYFVSTRQNPVKAYVNGPAEIRIDEWSQGSTTSRTETVDAGWHTLSLPPSADKAESLLRIKQRSKRYEGRRPIDNRWIARSIEPVPAAQGPAPQTQAPEKVFLKDAFTLGRQQDGTWSFGADLVRRNNVQEGTTTGPDPEQFANYRINHRYFDDATNTWWNSQAFARTREHGNPSWGVNEAIYFNPDAIPVNFDLNLGAYVQTVNNDTEWLGYVNTGASHKYTLTPKTALIPKLSFFARELSLHGNPLLGDREFNKNVIDQDVYTSYKADHTSGLNLSLTGQHRPWLDTLWTANLGTISNEDLDIFKPDHLHTEVHWKQLLGDVVADFGYRINHFQTDADRSFNAQTSNMRTRSQFTLDLDWHHWLPSQQMLQISGQYMYDVERQSHLAMLSFTFHLSAGRGYLDFRPGEFDFENIRQRPLSNGQNNQFEDSNF